MSRVCIPIRCPDSSSSSTPALSLCGKGTPCGNDMAGPPDILTNAEDLRRRSNARLAMVDFDWCPTDEKRLQADCSCSHPCRAMGESGARMGIEAMQTAAEQAWYCERIRKGSLSRQVAQTQKNQCFKATRGWSVYKLFTISMMICAGQLGSCRHRHCLTWQRENTAMNASLYRLDDGSEALSRRARAKYVRRRNRAFSLMFRVSVCCCGVSDLFQGGSPAHFQGHDQRVSIGPGRLLPAGMACSHRRRRCGGPPYSRGLGVFKINPGMMSVGQYLPCQCETDNCWYSLKIVEYGGGSIVMTTSRTLGRERRRGALSHLLDILTSW
jgi:hypothetical protein